MVGPKRHFLKRLFFCVLAQYVPKTKKATQPNFCESLDPDARVVLKEWNVGKNFP